MKRTFLRKFRNGKEAVNEGNFSQNAHAIGGQGRIDFDDGQGFAVAHAARGLNGGDVDFDAGKKPGYAGKKARAVHVPENDGVEFSVEIGFEAVNFLNADVPAADACAGNGKLLSVGEKIGDARGIGMRVDTEIDFAKLDVDVVRLGKLQGILEALVVRQQAEKPGDDSAIGGVTFARCRERAVKLYQNIRIKRGGASANPSSEQPEPNGARRVGAGRTDHCRSDNVKCGISIHGYKIGGNALPDFYRIRSFSAN